MTKVIGITGGIGSGKTTLCKHLKKKGYLVHDSDKFVSSIYKKPNKRFLKFLKKNVSKDFSCFIVPEFPDHIKHAFYKAYVFVNPEGVKEGWDRDRMMSVINELGAPCFSGSCCEIYKENCFSDYPETYQKDLANAKALDLHSLMFLVHPTLNDLEFSKTLTAIQKVASEASI